MHRGKVFSQLAPATAVLCSICGGASGAAYPDVGSLKRAKPVPDLPAVDEAGYAGYEAGSWFGLLAPAGTPREIVVMLDREVNNALNAQELNERLNAEGAEPAGNTPEQFTAFIRMELVKWGKVAKAAGIERQ